MNKENIDLSGVSETMLIPMYARYLESQSKNPSFYDKTSVKVINSLNYDFKKFSRNKMNMWGCAARTTILDREVKEYIKLYPNANVINIACGLDDRFSRVDNGKIKWYNIDFKNVMKIRKKIILPHMRVVNISKSVFDFSWINEIDSKTNVLIIAEGILMYFTKDEVKLLFDTISDSFKHTTLLLELMSKWMVKNQKHHDVTKTTSASFKWGIEKSNDFTKLCTKYKMIDEYSMTKEMKKYSPLFISLISPILSPINNRIAKFDCI